MKSIILSALLLASTAVFADSHTDAQLAKDWIKKQTVLPAGTATVYGTNCNLYFSYYDYGSTIFVAVGDNNSSDEKEKYVGVPFNSNGTKIAVTNKSYTFDSDGSWHNKSTRNKVIVDVDGTGKPIHATGISDLQTISCDLK